MGLVLNQLLDIIDIEQQDKTRVDISAGRHYIDIVVHEDPNGDTIELGYDITTWLSDVKDKGIIKTYSYNNVGDTHSINITY